jgi:hypothetical protein
MKINFQNYIETQKLPATKVLYPLFEAVSNSIDSIDEGNIKDGIITITLERIPQGLMIEEGEENRELLPIQNFMVEDNGVGFTDVNFGAFSELNTVMKKSRGGKGVGRVVWLKVFDYAEIQSTYSNGNDSKENIHFKFVCDENAIELIKKQSVGLNATVKTSVRLVNCKSEYLEAIPKKRNVIAQEIVIHFLPYFMVSNMPEIVIKENGLEDIDLWSVFESYISDEGQRERFTIAKNEFNVTHTKTKYHSQRNKEHRIFYVAHGRVVETRPISSDKVAHLPARLQMDDDEYVYVGYVESSFLDKNVNQSRYTFDIPDSTEGDTLFEQVDWKSIEEQVNISIGKYLGDYLEEARKDKDEKIRQFINEKAPNYSYIYTQHKDEVDKIPYRSIEKGNTGQELAKIHMQLREDFTEEAEEVLNIPDNEIKSSDEYKQKVNSLVERMNPTGKADLAEYIIHRKTILHLFEKALKIKDDGRFVKEDVIHSYVFPIKKSTDEITYDKHNLWLLDERLAYNTYIASDKPFGQISGFEDSNDEDKRKRPDIYAYTFSTVEPDDTGSPFKSLDVFEFKRPMRNDYKSGENPYNQIKDYLEIIRQGDATTKDKRSFRVIDGGLIYCHVICDFTQSLTKMLEREDFKQVGNQDWYIRYHQTYNAFIEVKSFEFVLETATKRNQILFDKLGLK